MEIRLAGDVTVRVAPSGGPEAPEQPEAAEQPPVRRLQGRQQRLLFAMLTLERDRGVARETLAEALWPDGSPPTWPAALRGLVSRVRAFVGEVLDDDADPLSFRDGRYVLHLPDDVVVDVELAEWAVAVAREALAGGDPRAARQMAEGALPCLRDPFLGGHDGAWVATRRAHLTELLIAALEVVSRAASTTGDTLGALRAAHEAVTRAPLRESAHRCLMAAHVAGGNRAESLRAYQRLRRMLAEELGVDPAPETEAAYLDLLGPHPSRAHPDDDDQPARPAPWPPAGPAGPRPDHRTELGALVDAWKRASAGERCMALVTGPPAAGKRALVAEVARQATAGGGLVLFGRCDGAPPNPYQPVVDALDPFVATMLDALRVTEPPARAELHRVFPSLCRPGAPGFPRDEAALFDAVADVVAAAASDRPVMVVLDGLHRADAAAFRLLRHLLHRTGGVRLLVAGIARDGDLGPDHPLRRLGRWGGHESWWTHVALPPAGGREAERPADCGPVSPTTPATLAAPVGQPVPGRLPSYTTSFVGRDQECRRILAALRGSQVVTLTGEGGIGKTRLAVEAAQRATLADHPDGVRFCDLSSIPDADGLVEHVAAAAGVALAPGAGARGDLLAALRSSLTLLVLDSCDRLRGPVARLLDEVVATAPGLRVLATTRAPLQMHGEEVIPVQPLGWPGPEPSGSPGPAGPDGASAGGAAGISDPPGVADILGPAGAHGPDHPAVRLLVDRARSAGATVDERDAALGEIARCLDDLPLAIELAAPRLATMPAGVLTEHLLRTVDVVADVVPRSNAGYHHDHRQTMQATIGWSFELLSPEAQRLLSGLSVFAGGWTRETAEVVVAEPLQLDREAVAPLLAVLVEQSMVRLVTSATAAARYTALAPIRAYAAGVLGGSGRRQAVADRHARHFVELAERAVPHRRGPLEPAWVGRLAVELDNLRAAYRWLLDTGRPADALRLVVALADDIIMREQLEIGRWAGELAALPELAGSPLRAAALAVASLNAITEGRLHDACRLSREALDPVRCPVPAEAAEAVEVVGGNGAAPSHGATGMAGASGANGAGVDTGMWPAFMTRALVTVAGAAEGDWTEPLQALIDMARDTGDPWPAAVAHYTHVQIATLAGRANDEADHATALAGIGSRSGNPTMRAMACLARGLVEAATDPDLAAAEYRRALDAATTAHNTLLVQQALRAIGELDARTDRTTALADLRAITHRFERSGNLTEQIKTILVMLDSVVASGAHTAAATICGALSQTYWRATAACRFVDRQLADALPPAEYLAARRAGAALSPEELVAYVSALVDELATA